MGLSAACPLLWPARNAGPMDKGLRRRKALICAFSSWLCGLGGGVGGWCGWGWALKNLSEARRSPKKEIQREAGGTLFEGALLCTLARVDTVTISAGTFHSCPGLPWLLQQSFQAGQVTYVRCVRCRSPPTQQPSSPQAPPHFSPAPACECAHDATDPTLWPRRARRTTFPWARRVECAGCVLGLCR